MASFGEEDLDYNLFYQCLQSKFKHSFTEAQNRCYTICVPQNSSLQGVAIDHNFLQTHILKPSPYFKGQLVTIEKPDPKTVHIKDNVLETGEGFTCKKFVKILAEENGYNKNFERFRILIIERPLGQNSAPQTSSNTNVKSQSAMDPLEPVTSLQQCGDFICYFKGCQDVLDSMHHQLHLFCHNYLVLRGYLDDAINKLRDIYNNTLKGFVASLEANLKQDKRVLSNLELTIESLILVKAHNKVFPVLKEENAEKDACLREKCDCLKGDMFGLPAHLVCDLTPAVLELERLDGLLTVLEKRICVKQTLDAVTQCVQCSLLEKGSNLDVSCLTSDELIPLMACVLVQSRLRTVTSHLQHMTLFCLTTASSSSSSAGWVGASDPVTYCLVTFTAAVTFLLDHPVTTEADVKMPTKPIAKKATSIKSSKSPRHTPLLGNTSSDTAAPDTAVGLQRGYEREINHLLSSTTITSGVEEVNREKVAAALTGPMSSSRTGSTTGQRQRQQPRQQPELGSFLSSLKADALPSVSGKQA